MLLAVSLFKLFLLVSMCFEKVKTYREVTKIFEDKLGSNSGYMTTVRPLLDQTQRVEVLVTFGLVAIVEIDAIAQKFVVNGFLGLVWKDELISWNPADYNYTKRILPDPKQIWRPRVIMTNTVDARDLFEDDYSPTSMDYNGTAGWYPGSLFPSSCKLNLYKFPFDEQNCQIEMYSMGWTYDEIMFRSIEGEATRRFYTKSGEWDVVSIEVVTANNPTEWPNFRIRFKLRRLPGFFIVNIVIPIVLMSFLNILVFIIPVDSGEKISFGITVLLALTVFMSIISEQLPRSSDTLPLMTLYLLVLTVISVCTVIVSIIIVFLHHWDEAETKHQKATSNFKSLFHKLKLANKSSDSFSNNVVKVRPATPDRQVSNSSKSGTDVDNPPEQNPKNAQEKNLFGMLNMMKGKNLNDHIWQPEAEMGWEKGDYGSVEVNRLRQIGKNLDCISFFVFTCIWVSVTIGFLVEISG